MNKMVKKSLYLLAVGTLAVSCADYNETSNFVAQPDPTVVVPYADMASVKSYTDKVNYPNMTVGTQLKLSDFNNQALQHSAAMANFDDVTFGKDLMSGQIINSKGSMNFLPMTTLVEHAKSIGATVYGSPIAANTNQCDSWFSYLTAPIEIIVDFIEEKSVDFTEMAVGTKYGGGEIAKFNDKNQLRVGTLSKPNASVNIADGFKVNHLSKYTISFTASAGQDKNGKDKDASFQIVFSGNEVLNPATTDGKYNIKAGKRAKFEVECRSAEGVKDGVFTIKNGRNVVVYVENIEVGYYPDNHRDQYPEEVSDTIHYAINTWCDGLMKTNEGCIKTFDLIDEPIDVNATLENGKYDLKHAEIDPETGKATQIFWQDIFGSEKYAPTVAEAARKAYEKYGNNPAELKFFIAETGLEEQKKLESLTYWIEQWENSSNGNFKVDGINAKLNLVYNEDATTQQANEKAVEKLLDNLAATGKLIRISNFDIKYTDAEGASVAAAKITEQQRQQLANYYGWVINKYMTTIPSPQQAGICKGSMVDTTDPVGLWLIDTDSKDWVRNATYKAFCDALSGKTN